MIGIPVCHKMIYYLSKILKYFEVCQFYFKKNMLNLFTEALVCKSTAHTKNNDTVDPFKDQHQAIKL